MSSKQTLVTEFVCDYCNEDVEKKRISHIGLVPKRIIDFCDEECFHSYVIRLKSNLDNFKMEDSVFKDGKELSKLGQRKELRMFTRKEFAKIRFKYMNIAEQVSEVVDIEKGEDLDILALTVRECKGGYEILEAKVFDEDSPEAFFEILRNGIN